MVLRHAYKNSTWVNLEHPRVDEVKNISEEFGLDPFVSHDLIAPTPKSKVENFENHVYAVIHFPVFKHSHKISDNQEVDFVIGRNFLITTHYDTVDALHKFGKAIEKDSVINKSKTEVSGSALFYAAVKEIYRSLHDEFSYIGSWLEQIDSQIFSGKEKSMVKSLSEASRTLLRFKNALTVDKEIFLTLQTLAPRSLDSELAYYAHLLSHESSRALAIIESHMNTVAELRETNNSLLSTRQNEITKIISIIALIALPLSLGISLLQTEIVSRTIISSLNDFWVLLGIFTGISLALYLIVKIKKWL